MDDALKPSRRYCAQSRPARDSDATPRRIASNATRRAESRRSRRRRAVAAVRAQHRRVAGGAEVGGEDLIRRTPRRLRAGRASTARRRRTSDPAAASVRNPPSTDCRASAAAVQETSAPSVACGNPASVEALPNVGADLVAAGADRRADRRDEIRGTAAELALESASTVTSGTPAASPRQPACAAATAPVRRSAISSGTQSAVWIAAATRRIVGDDDVGLRSDASVRRRRRRAAHRRPRHAPGGRARAATSAQRVRRLCVPGAPSVVTARRRRAPRGGS